MTRRCAVLLGVGAAGTGTLAAAGWGAYSAFAATALPRRLVAPKAGRRLGVAGGGFYDTAAVTRFARLSGTHVSYCLPIFSDVADGLSGFRLGSVKAAGYGAEVAWQPKQATTASIAAGAWDDTLRQSARFTKSVDLRIRFGHEMNGEWNPWSADAQSFVQAWRRIHGIFRAEGNSARFVWTPNISDRYVLPFEPFYPGDDFCDLVGLDGYARKQNRFKPFQDLFATDFRRLQATSSRPLVVGETGVSKDCTARAAWIVDMFNWLVRHPAVRELTYWNRDEYALSSDKQSLAAFRHGFAGWSV